MFRFKGLVNRIGGQAMSDSLFWFSDEEWSKIEPHLPTNQRGPERKDDRRILSGIMYVMKVDCRWKDCPADYGPHKTSPSSRPQAITSSIERQSMKVASSPPSNSHLRTADIQTRLKEANSSWLISPWANANSR